MWKTTRAFNIPHSANDYLSNAQRGILLAEPCTIQGMEFESVLVFQIVSSHGLHKNFVSPAVFSFVNRYFRAKYKLALVNIVDSHAELDKECMQMFETAITKSGILDN